MKKRNKILALCYVGIMGVLMFLLTGGVWQKEVFAEESASTAVAKPYFVELSETEENELWKGDLIYFENSICGTVTEGIYCNKIEIVKGDSVEVYDIRNENTGIVDFLGIQCVKTGKSTIRVHFVDEDEKTGTTTYVINVLEGEEISYSDTNMTIRVGDTVPFIVDNMRYGSKLLIDAVDEKGAEHFFTGGWGGWAGSASRNDKILTGSLGIAICPGEVAFKLWDTNTKEIYTTGLITIEEPVIETNAPMVVGVGDKFNLETMLTNISSESFIVKEIYEPEISIIEGADCVKQAKNEYTDFTTSDTLTFDKAGTVKISVKYAVDTDNSYIQGFNVFSAEKVITIIVAEENEEIINNVEQNDTTIITKENFLNIYKNNNCLKVNVTEDNKLLYMWQFAPKNSDTMMDVNIKVDMGVEDKDVAKLAKGLETYVLKFHHHGKLPDNTSVKVLVPDTFDDVKAYVYHLEDDGTATLTYEGMVIEGYINMPLDHCSTYFITKEKLEVDEKPTIEETTTEKTTNENDEINAPDTGDNYTMTMYMVLIVIAVGVLAVVGRKKVAN